MYSSKPVLAASGSPPCPAHITGDNPAALSQNMTKASSSPLIKTMVLPRGVEILGSVPSSYAEILTPEALAFCASLERRFRLTRKELVAQRVLVQARIDAGYLPDFLPETAGIRKGEWKIAPVPDDLADRRVEITGPVDRKMIINALNSGANVFMADFEDSNTPSWANSIQGQINLRDAARGEIEFTHPTTGKKYQLAEKTATLMVRPRGWHLVEKHMRIDGRPISASIFDFALYFFHNVRTLLSRGTGPYFYLPKLENHLEAQLWNDVFVASQDALNVSRGTIKATVLIETILAAFEMDEILYELREHSAGLNCGRWDYIFSFIKKFRNHPSFVMPDRNLVGMDRHFLRSYSLLLIRTCHRRGAHAIGGMAAQIPIKNDPDRNLIALDKVRADKKREAGDGHDGTWVAHPGLISLAREEFDAVMHGCHQIHVLRDDVKVTAEDLLKVPGGPITEAGLRQNLNVGIQYLEAWLSGTGCVPIYDLMEDAATCEISRTQVWQWIRHGSRLQDGRKIDVALVRQTLDEEMESIQRAVSEERFQNGRFDLVRRLFDRLITTHELEEFLTLGAYEHV